MFVKVKLTWRNLLPELRLQRQRNYIKCLAWKCLRYPIVWIIRSIIITCPCRNWSSTFLSSCDGFWWEWGGKQQRRRALRHGGAVGEWHGHGVVGGHVGRQQRRRLLSRATARVGLSCGTELRGICGKTSHMSSTGGTAASERLTPMQ